MFSKFPGRAKREERRHKLANFVNVGEVSVGFLSLASRHRVFALSKNFQLQRMASMFVGSRVPLHCCAVEPKINVCGKSLNPLGEIKRGVWRAQLRSHSSRPPQFVKQQYAPLNSPRIGTANKGSTTMEAMSSGRKEATVSAGGRTREELKKLVMRAVTNTNRGKSATDEQRQYILALLQELEGLNPTADPINCPAFSGRWALLYTAPVDEKTSDKYAGTEEGPFLSRVKPASLGTVQQSRSFQVIDTERGAAENIAEFSFLGTEGSLTIFGSVVKRAAAEKGAVHVDVTFDSFVVKLGSVTFPRVSLSWISPKGWIETTYLDDNFRVGRGDKGSIFVAARAKQT